MKKTLLTTQFGAQFYHPDVVQAAEALNDLTGLPRYANIYRDEAKRDQDIWAEAVERTIAKWQAGCVEARTPRAYLEATVRDVLQERRQAQGRWQRRAEQETRVVTRLTAPKNDAELDALVAVAPFADSSLSPMVPMPAPHLAVVGAIEALDLRVPVEEVQAAFDGVCRGRESVFALAVSVMAKDKARGKALQSPVAIISKIAAEHSGKDEQWLRNRAAGHSTAECTARLATFEEEIEAEKWALNPYVLPTSSYHSGGMLTAAAVIGAIWGEVGEVFNLDGYAPPLDMPPTLAYLKLPQTDRQRESLEVEMSRSRGAWEALPQGLKGTFSKAGIALANARATADSQEWKTWRRLGVYYSFKAHQEETERRERIAAARNGSLASRADCGGDDNWSVDGDDGDDHHVP